MQFIPGNGGGGSSGSVIWNPGAAPDPAYATTWAEIMTAFSESTGEFRVDLDTAGGGTFDVPAGTYELESRFQFSRPAPAEGQVTVSLADGAVLRNLAGVYRNITLEMNPTAAPALELDNGRAIEFDVGAVLENAGTYPGLEVAAGETVGLRFFRGSSALATTAAIADLTAATAELRATFQSNSQASTDWVSGVAGTTLTYLPDNTFARPELATPPATVTLEIPPVAYPGAGVVAGCWGNGDPSVLLQQVAGGTVLSPTGNQITTTIVRCVSFTLPFPLLVNRVRGLGAGGSALNDIQIALYNYSTLARLTAALAVNGTADGTWISLASSLGLQLQANTPYFLAIASRTGTANTHLMGMGPAKTATSVGRIGVLPSAMPGSLADVAGNVVSQFFQFATVAGALPDPANALVAMGNWSGGTMPAIWLDSLDT